MCLTKSPQKWFERIFHIFSPHAQVKQQSKSKAIHGCLHIIQFSQEKVRKKSLGNLLPVVRLLEVFSLLRESERCARLFIREKSSFNDQNTKVGDENLSDER